LNARRAGFNQPPPRPPTNRDENRVKVERFFFYYPTSATESNMVLRNLREVLWCGLLAGSLLAAGCSAGGGPLPAGDGGPDGSGSGGHLTGTGGVIAGTGGMGGLAGGTGGLIGGTGGLPIAGSGGAPGTDAGASPDGGVASQPAADETCPGCARLYVPPLTAMGLSTVFQINTAAPVDMTGATITFTLCFLSENAATGVITPFLQNGSGNGYKGYFPYMTLSGAAIPSCQTGWKDLSIMAMGPDLDPSMVQTIGLVLGSDGSVGPWPNPTVLYVDKVTVSNGAAGPFTFDTAAAPFMINSGSMVAGSAVGWVGPGDGGVIGTGGISGSGGAMGTGGVSGTGGATGADDGGPTDVAPGPDGAVGTGGATGSDAAAATGGSTGSDSGADSGLDAPGNPDA
jgi:hypothetical protein